MKYIPAAVSRAVAGQVLSARKNSPSILFGVGVVSMVGSTVLACRATLKLEEVLDTIESDKSKAHQAKELVETGQVPEGTTYSDEEMKRDLMVITVRGVSKVVKLYAPAAILGGIGIICLTKSHSILQERNAALTAAYVAVDRAFKAYRARVVDRFGEETDRELRYETEEVDLLDESTGKVTTVTKVEPVDHGLYSRWFDEESSRNWNKPPYDEYNWVFLRQQQNWCNDMLHSRGYVTLNEVLGCLGLATTTAGQVVGWTYKRDNPKGDNFVDFGCWDKQHEPAEFYANGRDGGILLDFNVDGPIWEEIDEITGNA